MARALLQHASMPSARITILASVLALGLMACGTADLIKSGDAALADAQAPDAQAADAQAADAQAHDAQAADAGFGGAARPVDFVFRNAGEDPVVLGSICGGSWLGLSVRDEPLRIDSYCSCSCADFDRSQGSCAGCPAICLWTQELVVPGGQSVQPWDGVALDFATRPECYTREAPALGTKIDVQGCYDQSASNGESTCTSTSFTYDDVTEVAVVAQPPIKTAVPTQITIENQTGGAIEIIVDRCGNESWFQLDDADPAITAHSFCACGCDEAFNPAACPSCGACAEDVVKTLPQGGAHTLTWDGQFWYAYPSGCSARYRMPREYQVRAKACYTKAGESTETCAPINFYSGLGSPVSFVLSN